MSAPLAAFTTSAVAEAKRKAKTASKDTRPLKKSKSKIKPSVPLKHKRRKKSDAPVIEFDDSDRREYLTGFRKRKQQRIEKVRAKHAARAKEELKQARIETREARKEKAAENVRMEREAYGAESEDEFAQEEEQAPLPPAAYDTPEHFTTVTVSAWDPDADEDMDCGMGEPSSSRLAAPLESAPAAAEPEEHAEAEEEEEAAAPGEARTWKRKVSNVRELPPSSARAAKRAKSQSTAFAQEKERRSSLRGGSSSTSKGKGKAPLPSASAITSLLEPVSARAPTPPLSAPILGGGGAEAAKAGSTFHYETKAERAKERTKIKERRTKMADKRKMSEKNARMGNGGAAKRLRRADKGGGKAGRGAKGKSKKGAATGK